MSFSFNSRFSSILWNATNSTKKEEIPFSKKHTKFTFFTLCHKINYYQISSSSRFRIFPTLTVFLFEIRNLKTLLCAQFRLYIFHRCSPPPPMQSEIENIWEICVFRFSKHILILFFRKREKKSIQKCGVESGKFEISHSTISETVCINYSNEKQGKISFLKLFLVVLSCTIVDIFFLAAAIVAFASLFFY